MLKYKEIIDLLTVEDIGRMLNDMSIPFKDTGKALIMPTVCHNRDENSASWKLYFYKVNKQFYCYTECGAMSVFKFVEHYYQAREIEYNWYEDVYYFVSRYINNFGESEFYFENQSAYASEKESFVLGGAQNKQLPEYDSHILDTYIDYAAPEWLKDGISVEAMRKFGIKYSISQNKIIIPHRDINGRLVGIRGRALNEEEIDIVGKYAPLHDNGTLYNHPLSLNLYGLYENKENIKRSKICFIFEGEKSVLISESFHRPNCSVAVCGSNLNIHALKLLLKNCAPAEIVVCFDNEEKEKEDKYFNKLWSMCHKYINFCNFSFIYDRRNLTKKKDAPVDEGEEIFEELLKRRVKVR